MNYRVDQEVLVDLGVQDFHDQEDRVVQEVQVGLEVQDNQEDQEVQDHQVVQVDQNQDVQVMNWDVQVMSAKDVRDWKEYFDCYEDQGVCHMDYRHVVNRHVVIRVVK